MYIAKLREISRPHFYSIWLDGFFPRGLRGALRKASAFFALLSFGLSLLPFINDSFRKFGWADGLFFAFIFLFLLLSCLEFFYRSMKNEGLFGRIPEKTDQGPSLDYSLSQIIYNTDEIDASRALFETDIGRQIMLRCGIGADACKGFIHSSRAPVISSVIVLNGETANIVEYAAALYDADKSLQLFLSNNSINKSEFLGAATWVSDQGVKKRRRERFWSRENLGSIPSIGTSWSYGVSQDLGRYGQPFEYRFDIYNLDIENGYREREVSSLEGILERRQEANAIIIDDDESVARDIVGRLLKKIKLGIALPSVEHKSIIELDWNALVADLKSRGELEPEILKIFGESAYAGNIIIYIRDASGFIATLKNLGINLPSLISPYLTSSQLQVIAQASNADFHFFIETNPDFLNKFERIIPDAAGAESSINVLIEQALQNESQYGILFTYPSILAIANSAERFVTYGEMPGKALDMLTESAPYFAERGVRIVKEEDVSKFVSEKTGITTGPIKEIEAQKIEHLEELLHERVVGQEEAVKSIASAVRRSRSGIGNPKRPLASFLFLGPTGVGKTEVSKALAQSFFGDEKKMIRFDMSEYNGPDAMLRLIGDFSQNKTGLLPSRVRDNPYSVLLLDEFEKSAPDVLDLFLQILDEGIFTDALGRQVGCRNLIIIATSNAGSGLIWNAAREGRDLSAEKENIINAIIEERVFKPELLNRFDGVILFHPLNAEELVSVARLGLEKLVRRLKEQDIELVVNDEIVNYLVEKGADPQFGARSINRAIQNEIENLVAHKIVSGEARPGSKIEIQREELK
jgi:ATP-dependent Clp protease ATP-binding subunit ClpC